MKSLIRPALALLALTPFVQARLEENLPSGSFGVVKIENVAATRSNLENHPMAAALKNARMEDYLKPLLDKIVEKQGADKMAEFEKNREEVTAAFPGEFVFAVVKTPTPVDGHLPYDFVVIADTTLDPDAAAALFKKLGLHQSSVAKKSFKPDPKPDAEDDGDEAPAAAPDTIAVDEEYHGVTLHTLGVKHDGKTVTLSGWAVVNKTIVFATAPNVLRDLVDSRKETRKDSYVDSAVYKKNVAALANTDAWVLLDMPLVAGALHDLIAAKNEEGANPLFDVVKAYDTLALDAFTHVRISATLKADDTRTDSSIGWSEKRGLVKTLVTPMTKGAAPDIAVLPSDATVASTVRYDVGAFFKELDGLLHEALPPAMSISDMQLSKMKKEGLDVRESLLRNFGDSVWMIADMKGDDSPAPGSPPIKSDIVYVLSLKDRAKFESFVETALGKVAAEQTGDGVKSLFDEREIVGVKVRTLKQGIPGTSMSYAVSKDLLFIAVGESSFLDRTLAQFQDPRNGLDKNADVKAALAKLPENPFSVTYIDVGRYVESYAKMLPALLAVGKQNDEFGKLDASKAPKASDLPFFGVGVSTLGENELTSRTVYLRKSDANR